VKAVELNIDTFSFSPSSGLEALSRTTLYLDERLRSDSEGTVAFVTVQHTKFSERYVLLLLIQPPQASGRFFKLFNLFYFLDRQKHVGHEFPKTL
jgi:hypothetical protein